MTDGKDLKPIEPKGIDLSPFEGQRVRIESVEVTKVPSKFTANGDGEAEVLKVQSAPLETIKDKEGNEVPIRASELFNLVRGEDGGVGWPNGDKGKLAGFLKKMAVTRPWELVGKEAVVRVRAKKSVDGATREFLGFITDFCRTPGSAGCSLQGTPASP